MKVKHRYIIPFLLLLTVISLRISFPVVTEEIQLKVFDWYQRIKPRVYQDLPVRIIDIDNESLSRIGQWPWPRHKLAQMIRRIMDRGASVVALDMVFAEPDRTSPRNMLSLWPNEPLLSPLQSEGGSLPDHDAIFASAIADARVVTGFSLTSERNDAVPAQKSSFAFAGADPSQYLDIFRGSVTNLKPIEEAAAGNGSFNIIADHDAIIRRIPVVLRLQDSLYPSLAAEALRVAQGASTSIIKSAGGSGETSFGEDTGIVSIKIGNFVFPTDAKGRFLLYDSGYHKERFIPAWQFIERDGSPPDLEGKIVFVGTSAAGLKDLRTTPLNPVAAGVEVHAQIIEQILSQTFLYRPDWALGAEILYLFVLGLFLIFFLPMVGAAWCALLALVTIVGAGAASWYAYSNIGWLVDPVTPSLAILLIYLAVSLINFLNTEAERRQVRGAFSRYLSPALVERLAQDPDQLKLGGEAREMTILFADIRGFTTMSENYKAEDLTRFMNQFLTPMTDIILNHSGTIDKYMGDCIMAFWNAPFDDPNHASNACRAALEMQRRLKSWNREMAEAFGKDNKPFQPVKLGIGLNSGECSVGNMGSEQRFDYSVLGDNVNLSARLESVSKNYGVDIVIGPNTYTQAMDFTALEIDLIRVKGKTQPVNIYALLGDSSLKADQEFQSLFANHNKFIEAYRKQQWRTARDLLAQANTFKFSQKYLQSLYSLYQNRIETFQDQAPAPDWDGVFVATTK